MFGHSTRVGNQNYALQSTDSMRTISHTTIAMMQRTSLMYHETIGLSHPKATKIEDDQPGTRGQIDTPRLISSVNTTLEANIRRVTNELKEQMNTEFTSFAQGFGSEVLQRITYLNAPSLPTLSVSSPILVSPNLLKTITPLLPYGRSPAFTIPHQAEAIQSSMINSHVLIVMPTGSGKSLSFMAVPLLLRPSQKKIVVVITPLVALTEDMSRRLAATDIRAAKWTATQSPFDMELLLVSAHQAGTHEFFRWAVTNADWVHRIFIDEAHHIYLSLVYRDCFKLFHRLTEIGKPITFLSATIFPHSVPYLCEIMKIDPSLLLHIRAPITRSNLKIHATKFDDFDSMMGAVRSLVRSIDLGSQDRGLVFCTTTAHCRLTAKMLGVDYYVAQITPHEDQNAQEKTRLDDQWRNGLLPSHRWMVATLCFGQGIDLSGIRYVIHIELRNLIDYLQEIGRAGRDGNPASVHAFYTRLPPITDAKLPHDHAGVLPLRDFLETVSCRRLSLRSIDRDAHSCGALIDGQLCDNCDRMIEVCPIATVHQPMRLDLPRVSPTDLKSISVASNANILQEQRKVGLAELGILKHILDRISSVGCVECWFADEAVLPSTLPHSHDHDRAFKTIGSAMKAKDIPFMDNWPICYLCWVPFHPPCFHPPHRRKHAAVSEDCPHPGVLPLLVNLIWHDPIKRTRIEEVLGAQLFPISKFTQWIRLPLSGAHEIPRPHQFIVSYYKEYRQLPPVD
jgi:superfamily II DNA/RNA helicase